MDAEKENHVPFLGIDIHRRINVPFGHTVLTKTIHTNLYLNATSHHNPAIKCPGLSTLTQRVRFVQDQESVQTQFAYL
jgi:hypothetical protein